MGDLRRHMGVLGFDPLYGVAPKRQAQGRLGGVGDHQQPGDLADMRAKVLIPDTGDSAEDFRRHTEAVIRFYAGPEGRIFAQFIAEAQADPILAEEFREKFLKHRRAAVTSIFQRGVTRGEFRADIDPDVAMDMIFAPIIYRLLAGHAPLSTGLARRLVDAALNAGQTLKFSAKARSATAKRPRGQGTAPAGSSSPRCGWRQHRQSRSEC